MSDVKFRPIHFMVNYHSFLDMFHKILFTTGLCHIHAHHHNIYCWLGSVLSCVHQKDSGTGSRQFNIKCAPFVDPAFDPNFAVVFFHKLFAKH
jgi:hypothetical protein